MQLKSYARITLSLDIIKKLSSGYHEVEIIKTKIDLYDNLTIKNAKATKVVCKKIDDSIVLKAINALKKRYNINKHVEVTIQKNIPIAGGLAGGSSNAASVLLELNKLWNINAPIKELVPLARQIGRDVPCFFFNGLVFDKEVNLETEQVGELPKAYIIIVNDGINVSTKDAYSWLDYNKIGLRLASRKIKTLEDKKELPKYMHNDFEQFVFPKFPQLRMIKKELHNLGLFSLMSGSGSTVYGLSYDKIKVENAYNKIKNKYKTVILTHTLG